MEKEFSNEQEIHIKDLIVAIAMRWRIIIIISIILAVILGSFEYFKNSNVSEEKYNKNYSNYQYEYNAYYATIEMLNQSVKNINLVKERQVEYNNNSILMQIDPMNEYVGMVEYYIDTSYQINPALSYQDINKAGIIVNAYSTFAQSGTMYDNLIQKLDYHTELQYIKELITVEADAENMMFKISVVNKDEESCNELLNMVMEEIQKKKEEFTSSIGAHEIELINKSTYANLDFDLETLQNTNIQNVTDMTSQLKKTNEELKAAEEVPVPVFQLEDRNISISIIKSCIYGLLIGVCLMIIIFAFSIIMNDKLHFISEIKDRFHITVLGCLRKERKCFIDRWILKVFGTKTDDMTVEQHIQYIYETACAEINLIDNTSLDGEKKVLITGSTTKKNIENIYSRLNAIAQEGNLQFMYSGNIDYDIETVKYINEVDYVILVEKLEESKCSIIRSQMEAFRRYKKCILGIVVEE